MGLHLLLFTGICHSPQPNLSFSQVPSSPQSPEPAAPEAKPEPSKLLDHLRASLLPWDKRVLEMLSPKLTLGEGRGDRHGPDVDSRIAWGGTRQLLYFQRFQE